MRGVVDQDYVFHAPSKLGQVLDVEVILANAVLAVEARATQLRRVEHVEHKVPILRRALSEEHDLIVLVHLDKEVAESRPRLDINGLVWHFHCEVVDRRLFSA